MIHPPHTQEPGRPLVFDIESHSVNEQYVGPSQNFFRVGATLTLDGAEPQLCEDYHHFGEQISAASLLIGHNILAFDLPALSRPVGFDLLALTRARKIVDTWTLATVLDPAPVSYVNTGGVTVFPDTPERLKKYYALDNLAHQYGVPGKSHDLKQLAKEYGDPDACCQFGTIPTTNPQYRDYLAHDVLANRTVLGELLGRFTTDGKVTEYAWREMRVAAVCSQISQNGFRLDKQLTQARIDNNNAIQADRVQMLIDRYGLPTTNAAGQPAAKPTATKGGKEAILRALYDYGVDYADVPKTNKGQPSFGGEGLLGLAKKYPQATPVLEAVSSIQGLRTVYQTALDNCHVDGFCHPDIYYLQASGRLSVQSPGLTVFGKRGGRHHEREVFVGDVLPDEDEDFHVLWSVDFGQIDARAVAAMSQDHNYLDQFAPGQDLHLNNAIMAFGAEAVAANPKLRESAKAFGHGWNYGLGFEKLATLLGRDMALAFRTLMERNYPRLVQWKREMADEAERNGVLDNGFGRKMKANRDRAWTQGPALKGQGSARDLMFEAILRMDDQVVRMIKAGIHDELVFSAPKSVARDARQHAIECMTFQWCPPGAARPVQIIADATDFGLRWGDLYG